MRVVRRVLVVLVVLAALVVVVDRVGAWAAQRAVADQAAQELAAHEVDSAPPEVTFNRAPFLTQVAAGRYESVTLRLRDVGSGQVRLPLVELTARGVTATASTLIERDGPITAERVEGTATIGYASVTELAGLDGLELSAGDGGAVRVRVTTELRGTAVTLVGSADVAVTGGSDGAGSTVAVRPAGLTVESPDELPAGAQPLVDDIARQLAVDVPLPPLPYQLTVESVRAEPAGLAVSVSARNVPLAR